MQRIRLNSRSLHTAGYQDVGAVLELEFWSGAIYQFLGVPAESYQALLQAESHGRYFNSHIRNRFAFVRIQPAGQPQELISTHQPLKPALV